MNGPDLEHHNGYSKYQYMDDVEFTMIVTIL